MIPKVSIIVPCYGVEKYLDRCMDSLVNQSLKEIEIILVDDKSPDRVPEMCDAWAGKDSRIKVIHKSVNEGLGFARNTGLEVATGEYVAFVDSDDFVELNMYEKLYKEANDSGADVVFSNFQTEDAKGNWHTSNEVVERTEWVSDRVNEFMLDMVASAPNVVVERRFQMSVWHSVYRRTIINENNIMFLSERQIGSEDIPYQVDFLRNAKKVVYIPDSFYHYCMNATSLTANYKPDMFEKYKKLYLALDERLHDVSGALERIDRFFIGYSRYCITHLSLGLSQNSDTLLRNLLNDDIWKGISIRYQVGWLPRYPRVLYTLTLWKCKWGLKVISILVYIMKSITNRRNN